MTDQLPDDVYYALQLAADTLDTDARNAARAALAKYPRSQPEPAWQDGDVYLWQGHVNTYLEGDPNPDDEFPGADRIVHAGRRVHPRRFAGHAETLNAIADTLVTLNRDRLRAIAADLAGDPDA